MSILRPRIPGTDNIVAPYGYDINPRVAGTVKYTNFIHDARQLNAVSSFIRSHGQSSFTGTRMMVAEWNGVSQYGGRSVSV